jgi:hypothetical protein
MALATVGVRSVDPVGPAAKKSAETAISGCFRDRGHDSCCFLFAPRLDLLARGGPKRAANYIQWLTADQPQVGVLPGLFFSSA